MKLINKGGTLIGNVIVSRSGIETRQGFMGFGAIESVQLVNSTSEQKQGGWMGRTAVGALVAGPVGAIVGAATRNAATKNKVSFIITFKTGETFFTESSASDFNEIYGKACGATDKDFKPAAFSAAGKFGKDPKWLQYLVIGLIAAGVIYSYI